MPEEDLIRAYQEGYEEFWPVLRGCLDQRPVATEVDQFSNIPYPILSQHAIQQRSPGGITVYCHIEAIGL